MRRVLATTLVLCLGLAAALPAQEEDGATRLERLLQDSLSGAGREVTVRGFSGALSGRAEMASLTIADEDGVWLSLSDAVLDWNRLALLRGRLEVAELSAARIEMPRRPVADTSDPLTPEASGTGFQLPELPVAVRVGALSAEALVLGAPVLGQPLTMTLEGALRLEDGEGELDLALERTDGARGEIALRAAFANATEILSVDLLFDEGQGGVAAGLLGLPGSPTLRLSVAGTGPLDDFAADLALATDGEDRLAGTISTLASEADRRFEVDIAGDIRPLVEPQLHPFVGASAELAAIANVTADGATDLERLSIETGALNLQGTAAIGPDGLPRRFDLEGRLADPTGAPLVLPGGGVETRIAGADLTLAFDAATGDDWRGTITVEDLSREGFSAARFTVDGAGTIRAEPAAVTAGVDFRAEALDFGRAEAQQALGEAVTGRADIAWSAGNPVEIETIRVTGETYEAALEGTVENATSTLDIAGTLELRADELAVFAGLAGRPLSGAVTASLNGQGSVISGLADLRAAIVGRDLAMGDPRVDPYLAGETSVETALRRTTEGIFLDTLRLAGPQAEARVSGELKTGEGVLSAVARLGDIAPLAEGLSGAAEARLDATMSGGVWTWGADASAMAADLSAEGTLQGLFEAPLLTAAGQVEASALSGFSDLAGRTLGGAASLEFSARAEPANARYGLDVEGSLVDALTGVEQLDRLLDGTTELALTGALEGDALRVDRLSVRSPRAEIEGTGAVAPDFRGLALDARAAVTDIGDLVEGVTGAASLSAQIVPQTETGPWDVRVTAETTGTDAEATGTLSDLAGVPEAEGSVLVSVEDLGVFGALLDRPLGGSVSLSGEGAVRADLSEFDITLDGTARDARTGIEALDRILAGATRLEVDAERSAGTILVRAAGLETPLLQAEASGTVGRETAFSFSGRLADIAPFVDGFSGPVTAEGRAEAAGDGRATVEAALLGPAGARADISGSVAETGADADLSITGTAPLGLANGVIAPRAIAGNAGFNLRLAGPLALESLSGRVTTQGALLTAPVLDIALENIAATIDLAGGRAAINLDSQFRGGGAVRLDGPITLSGSLPADLTLVLEGVRLTDPALYQTILDARLAVAGPLTGGASITGRVDVGESELRIPSAGGRTSGGLPEITHIGEPAGSRATRARAGLIGEGASGRGGAAAAFLLDVLVNAPNRIFVRGRGLDAELGGQVRIGGTTQAVAPAGRFDLIRGRLDILGRRLNLTEGATDLTGALDPRLRLVAETQAEGTDISIIVEGPASDPQISFTSRPELPEDEVLALLLFGRGIETLSPLQVARLAGAVATLGSSGGGLIGGLRAGAGLADLDVTSGENGGAAVRAGTYIADNVYTDVTVDTEGEAVINLNLDLSPSVTVRGSTSNTGDSGLGVFFERDY